MFILRKLINSLCVHVDNEDHHQMTYHNRTVPTISITPNQQDTLANIKASISIAKSYTSNEVVVNQVQIMDDREGGVVTTKTRNIAVVRQASKESMDSVTSKAQISESDVKKITRTISNGTKRKNKTKRLGSRQNSKTESDSSDDDAQNVVLEAPRKCKRKTSRAKKLLQEASVISEGSPVEETTILPSPSSSGAATAQSQGSDDVVYVLKIRPKTNSSIKADELDNNSINTTIDNSILISPTETCVELRDSSLESITTSTANIFVKTKRKIFSPVGDDEATNAVIAKELESSSASDRNDNAEYQKGNNNDCSESDKIIRNLPPLPQSPCSQRRMEQQKSLVTKELSPSIRMMITKYNQKLTAEKKSGSPMSSGSCSPVAWRSPVLERRVRAQTEKYQETIYGVKKSSSVESLRRCNTIEKSNSCNENDDKLKGVLKSLSAGRLETHWRVTDVDISDEVTQPEFKSNVENGSGRKERLYKKNPEGIKTSSSKYHSMKKVKSKQDPLYKHSVSAEMIPTLPDKADNLNPRITRKYDALLTPTSRRSLREIKIDNLEFDLLKRSSTTPNSPDDCKYFLKPSLNERALKLKIAKEEFLKTSPTSTQSSSVKRENLWNNRLSQISGGSESQSSTDEILLTKSASVGTIGMSPNDNQHIGGYVSLPRNIRPTEKSSNRFALSNIAQKFRKVKLRRGSKESNKMNTVSRLCRQSLIVDITGTAAADSPTTTAQHNSDGSTTFGLSLPRFTRRHDHEKLKKSKSVSTIEEQCYEDEKTVGNH